MPLHALPLKAQPLMGKACRLVNSEKEAASLSLTDTLDEQSLLESIIDAAKPPRKSHTDGLHYLLANPFRYPPLRHGSRFGQRHEDGILYASLQTPTCLAEVAFYRFRWWHDMETPPPHVIQSGHTLFAFQYHSNVGLDLTGEPFQPYQDVIRHPAVYAETQAVGSRLRQLGIEAALYLSARCLQHGRNVALFSPQAVHSQRPENMCQVLCETRGNIVFFLAGDNRYEFELKHFLFHDVLPFPAH